MNMSGIFARIVALIGAVALLWRRLQGSAPRRPGATRRQFRRRSRKAPSRRSRCRRRRAGATGKSQPRPGLKVNAFAKDLDHPRWINVLPNGDVLIAESTQIAGPPRSVFHYAMQATMRRAAALGVSADRITCCATLTVTALPKAAGFHGRIEPAVRHGAGRRHLLCRQHRRRGRLSLRRGRGPHHRRGAEARRVQASGHWTRSLLPSADGKKLYAGVGSLSNIAEMGMEVEEGRAAIYELDLAGGTSRIFASGLRNAVGLAWEPTHPCSGPSSTSATASATRRRRTI
jgi:glucose/arabinose dehydrogenase